MPNLTPYMVAFEEKVVTFQKENEEVQKIFVRGSDEHLDVLINVREILSDLNRKFSEFLIDAIPSSNKLSNEEVEQSIPTLLETYSSSIRLVASLKRSSIGKDLNHTSEEYYTLVENFRELIYDLEHFRYKKTSLTNLLDKINDL